MKITSAFAILALALASCAPPKAAEKKNDSGLSVPSAEPGGEPVKPGEIPGKEKEGSGLSVPSVEVGGEPVKVPGN